jgi:hypothetical protein
MANIQTPISAAETKAQMENAVQNPEIKVGGSEASGGSDLTVTVNLHFASGQTFSPKELYEALDAKYGTVASMESTVARNNYNFLISA